jgi:hypothetical protein
VAAARLVACDDQAMYLPTPKLSPSDSPGATFPAQGTANNQVQQAGILQEQARQLQQPLFRWQLFGPPERSSKHALGVTEPEVQQGQEKQQQQQQQSGDEGLGRCGGNVLGPSLGAYDAVVLTDSLVAKPGAALLCVFMACHFPLAAGDLWCVLNTYGKFSWAIEQRPCWPSELHAGCWGKVIWLLTCIDGVALLPPPAHRRNPWLWPIAALLTRREPRVCAAVCPRWFRELAWACQVCR